MFLDNIAVEMGLLWHKIASGSPRSGNWAFPKWGTIPTVWMSLDVLMPVLSVRVPCWTTVTKTAGGPCKAGYG